jgi:hypothetical protein
MDAYFYVAAVAIVGGGVVLWIVYQDTISFWIKGGPRPATEIMDDKIKGLAHRVDAMMAAKNTALQHADILEREIAQTRADLAAATGKLIP